ncbi:MAG: phage tail sheath family protein [Alphaproteobacteria bacterium]
MPVNPTYPGVYVEEIPSGSRAISGVSTSTTAFVGYAARGLDNRAKRIFSFGDFEKSFGGLDSESEMSYAVQQYFLNGGSEAYIVRVPKNDAVAASIVLRDGSAAGAKNALQLTALSKGAWANDILVDVDYSNVSDDKSFNLTITDVVGGAQEVFANVTIDTAKANYVVARVNDEDSGSRMVLALVPDAAAGRPMQTGTEGGDITLSDLKNDKAYGLKVSADVPAGEIDKVDVTIIEVGENLPASVLGLAKLVERKLNEKLGEKLAGAAVKVGVSASGKGLHVVANFSRALLNGSLDAGFEFFAAAENSILGTLKLSSASASNNVGHYRLGKGRTIMAQITAVEGADGSNLPKTADLIGKEADFSGVYALEKVDMFNILCIPDATRAKASDPSAMDPDPDDAGNPAVDYNAVYTAAMAYCEKRRAFLIVDPPPTVTDTDKATDWVSGGLNVSGSNGAAYFPRLRMPDPLDDYRLRTFAPCGAVAGLYAKSDASRGVWSAPAGTDATLAGVSGLVYSLNDAENGALNPLGLNCIRSLPVYGTLSWGTRTLDGADALQSEWKYVPVRRLALMVEEALFRGTKWAVFRGNDEPLWADLRTNVTSYMHTLFRQGAFQGETPQEAYLVKCDSETTTQDDIDRGIVNVVVGFAPLKPAEFVILKIQQIVNNQ